MTYLREERKCYQSVKIGLSLSALSLDLIFSTNYELVLYELIHFQ